MSKSIELIRARKMLMEKILEYGLDYLLIDTDGIKYKDVETHARRLDEKEGTKNDSSK